MLARFAMSLGLTIILLIYGELLAHAPATGQDFRLFYAAATVLHEGGNPYNVRQLVRTETRLYHPTTASQRASLAGNPMVQGPLLLVALLPAVGRPPMAAFAPFAVLLGVLAALAQIVFARAWPVAYMRRRILLGLVSPVTFLCIMLGQPDPLLLLATAIAVWALQRRSASPSPDTLLSREWLYAAAAGLVLSVGLIKPQIIAGPILLLGLMAARHRRLAGYCAGLLVGSAVFAGLTVLVVGPEVLAGWLGELAGFGKTTIYGQVDISSLSTLYVGWAPHGLSLALTVLLLLGWAVVSVWQWRRCEREGAERRWLVLALTLWMLATPYAHPHDDILLLPVAWYLLGEGVPDSGWARLVAALLFASWWLLPLTSVLGLRPPLIRGLGIVPVLLLTVMLIVRQAAEKVARQDGYSLAA
jgi:hypothetical protein